MTKPKHGSMLLYVHRNRKTHEDGKPRTATSTFTQLLNSPRQSQPKFQAHVHAHTQVQCQTLTTHKYSAKLLLHTSTAPNSYYTQVQRQTLTTHKYSAKLLLHTSTVPIWLLHTRTVSTWLLHTSSANLVIAHKVFFSFLLLIICACVVYLGGKQAWRGQLKSC